MVMKIRSGIPQSTLKGCVVLLCASVDVRPDIFYLDYSSFKMQKAHAKKKNAWHSYSEIYHSITHASPL